VHPNLKEEENQMKTYFPAPELGVEAAAVEESTSENAVAPVRKTFELTCPTLVAVDQCPTTYQQSKTSVYMPTA
jgi:hypothetical protein